MLQDLYDSEINACIWWNWDGGVEVRMGNGIYGEDKNWEFRAAVQDMDQAYEWLAKTALKEYPESKFAMNYHERVFQNAVRPAIKFLAEEVHPHHTIVVTATEAELSEGSKIHATKEFLRD